MSTKRRIPKYQVIKDTLLSWGKEGQLTPGSKLPIEGELAKIFSASRQTVRQAVGELVQEGILERKQGSGTYLRDRRTNSASPTVEAQYIIGVITTYISDYIFPHIIRGIEERLSIDGYSPLLFSTQNDPQKERRALEAILARSVDGVIVEPTKSAVTSTNGDLFAELQTRGIPVVMLHATYDELDVPKIEVNDHLGAVLATEHLISLGHTKIGGIMKIDDKQGMRRFEGFLHAGGTFTNDLMSFYTTEGQLLVCQQYVDRLMKMTPTERPTAVFCYNDAIASDFIVKLRERGFSVPNDISVIGFDDSQLATLSSPPLTTIEHPKMSMGIKAAETILQLLHDPDSSRSISTYTFQPQLVIRESTQELRILQSENAFAT